MQRAGLFVRVLRSVRFSVAFLWQLWLLSTRRPFWSIRSAVSFQRSGVVPPSPSALPPVDQVRERVPNLLRRAAGDAEDALAPAQLDRAQDGGPRDPDRAHHRHVCRGDTPLDIPATNP